MASAITVPDVVGEVYGVRQWHFGVVVTNIGGPVQVPVSALGLALGDSDIARLGTWVPGINHAVCRMVPSHQPPVVDCGCGLYAYNDDSCFARLGTYGIITGLVRGWGKVAVARDGWRAQYAEVVALQLSDVMSDGVLERIAKAYDVPVMTSVQINELAKQYGIPEPLRLRRRPPRVAAPVAVGAGAFTTGDVFEPHSRPAREVFWTLLVLYALAATIFLLALLL